MFVMNNENPDHSTSVALSSGTVKLMPSNRTLWRALFWAPAVAPLAFVALVLLVGIVGEYFGSEVNPASILVLRHRQLLLCSGRYRNADCLLPSTNSFIEWLHNSRCGVLLGCDICQPLCCCHGWRELE